MRLKILWQPNKDPLKHSTEKLGIMVVLATAVSVVLIILSLTLLSIHNIPPSAGSRMITLSMYGASFLLVLLITVVLDFFIRYSEAVEDAAKSKDSFIANVSHEIKTPLNAITGMVHMLRRTDLSDRQRELVNKVEISSNLLLDLITGILDFSKIKNGTLNLYSDDFLLRDMLRDIEGIFSPLVAEKGLDWRIEYDFDENLILHLDRIRLTQVLLNLLSNALKFTSEGSISLAAAADVEESGEVLVSFSVEDTGIGIDSKDSGKLFREFVQLENPLTKQHHGTGLGLALCQHIVKGMGGKIWHIENPWAKSGTQFNFTVLSPPAAGASDIPCIYPEALPSLDGGGQRILIAEDTEINFELAAAMLSEVNLICDRAKDGLEAIALCDSHPKGYYQLILMDIHMPKLDGYAAATVLKRERDLDTPILALTATDIDADSIRKYRGILDDFISKPFKPARLYQALLPYFSCDGSCCNVREAIENMGGKEHLYEKHLRRFQEAYADTADRIQSALSDGDFAEAGRLAHSVKGLSATLGMTCLQRASANLETAIADGIDRAEIFTLLKAFEVKLIQARTV